MYRTFHSLIAIGLCSAAITWLACLSAHAASGTGQTLQQRAQAMIDRAELQKQALRFNLLFELVPPLANFTFANATKTIAEWYVEVDTGIDTARALYGSGQYSQAQRVAELAKDIADAINTAFGFTIGYWSNQGAFSRANIKVLLIRDDYHNFEWWEDTFYIKGILDGLGYAVTFVEEGDLLATHDSAASLAQTFANYQVVWLSNPGWPFDDLITLDALKLARDSGVGIVVQSDDVTTSGIWSGPILLPDIEALSGLTPFSEDPNGTSIDNNSGPVYDVTVGIGHPLQTGISGTTFHYGDDIDTATSIGASVLATTTPVPGSYPISAKPVIAAYQDPVSNGRSVTIMLVIQQLEIFNPALKPSFDNTLCDNAVLWASR